MNFKKLLSSVCVATLCLSGCGGNETSSPTDSGGSEEESIATYEPLMDLYRQAIEESDIKCVVDYFPETIQDYTKPYPGNSEVWMYDSQKLKDIVEYAYYDINEDGVVELLIGYKDDYSDDTILISVYSISEGEISNLIHGWSRHFIQILEDHTIYSSGSAGISEGGSQIQYKISSDCKELEAVAGISNYKEDFKKIVDGKEVPATREEHDEYRKTIPEAETDIPWQLFF